MSFIISVMKIIYIALHSRDVCFCDQTTILIELSVNSQLVHATSYQLGFFNFVKIEKFDLLSLESLSAGEDNQVFIHLELKL